MWLSHFPDATVESYVFPRHQVQMLKGGKESKINNIDLEQPVQSWQHAWRTALKAAKVKYRWHDLRHTFISRIGENPGNSESTIKALAGHVTNAMLERYCQARKQAKHNAIAQMHAERDRELNSGNCTNNGAVDRA
jgi:integrase